jgi:hypothetical protein
VPPDHEIFEKLSRHQWLWLQAMVEQDYLDQIEMLEYQIAFIPDAAEQVKRAIEARKDDSPNKVKVSDDDFGKFLQQEFGRELDEDLDVARFIPER